MLVLAFSLALAGALGFASSPTFTVFMISLFTIGSGDNLARSTATLPEGVHLLQELSREELEKIIKDISPSIYPAARIIMRL